MIRVLQDLVRHNGYANACLLRAVRQSDRAAQDREILTLLHHIIRANRFWFYLSRGRPFTPEGESRTLDTLAAVAASFQDTHVQEIEWVTEWDAADLGRTMETPFIPGRSVSIAQAILQVCLHSHGHRAQCATMLRMLGGTPPPMDFVIWLKDRPAPDWS